MLSFRIYLVAILLFGALASVTLAAEPKPLLQTAGSTRDNLDAIISAQDETQARELAYLKHRLDSLQALVRRLIQHTQLNQSNDSLLACVTDDLALLKFENQYLRTMLQATFAQYASTDDEEISESQKPELGQLSLALTELNESLQDILDKRQTQQPAIAENASGISYTGWIDVSNSAEFNTHESDFNLDQVELDLSTEVAERGSLRADIEYVSDYAGGFDLNLEQAFFTYALTTAGNLSATVGKFNAPVGWEVVDPDGVYLYTYSLVREYGLPTNVVGLQSNWTPTSGVDVKLWIANGWDQNTDNNKDKTLGARFGLTPVGSFTLGVSGLYGPEQDQNVSSKRSVIDADLTWSPTERLTFAGDATLGNESHILDDGGIASWSGAMFLTQLAVTSKVTLFGRFDYFNDEDGARTGTAQEWKAVALSPNIQVSDAFLAGVELRYDWSNRDSYSLSDGTATNSQVSSALQFTYGF